MTPPPLKHRRNAGRRAGSGRHSRQPASARPRRARASPESPGGGAEGGLGGGPERATKASAPVAVVPGLAGAQFSGPAGGVGETRALGCPPRPPPPPRALGQSATAAPRTGPRGLPPPRGVRARPARSPLALSSFRPASILDRRFQPPRRCRRIPPLSRPPPPSPPPALTSAAHPGAAGRRPSFPPKVSGVLFPMWGGFTGWSPGVRERGPRLQRSCNPNPPSGGIFHTPMAPLQTWVRTALCWPRCSLALLTGRAYPERGGSRGASWGPWRGRAQTLSRGGCAHAHQRGGKRGRGVAAPPPHGEPARLSQSRAADASG